MLLPRLRALCDLFVPAAREDAGLHEYDGRIADLSPEAVAAGLARVGGPPLDDPHDEAHLAAFEDYAQVYFDEVALQRRNPRVLIDNLDISAYAREYAPEAERAEARRRHVAAWPGAIDAGLAALDAVAAPTAAALLPSARALVAPLDPELPEDAAALAAHGRLVAHLERAAAEGHPDPALGARALERLLGAPEALTVRLDELQEAAEAERERLQAMLTEACGRVLPGVPAADAMRQLTADHPDAGGVLDAARDLTDEVLAFTEERGLLEGGLDGIVHVAPSPPSRRWATAMMSWAAPFEDDGPSWFLITPPDPAWPAERRRGWLAAFSHTSLPATTAHEVAPGHFVHSRLLRRAPGAVRRALFSPAFVEGWAHYAEELLVEEGFRADDPRYVAGVAMKALMRVTRLATMIGLHADDLTLGAAAARFRRDAYLQGPAAEAEAKRATIDPTYGRYTWGKLVIRDVRELARRQQGGRFSLARFHRQLLTLGAPPLGLLPDALDPEPHG